MEGVRNPADLSVVEADIAEIAADIAALVVDVADLETDVAALQSDVTDIKAVTDGLPTLSEAGGTVTTDGTEQNSVFYSSVLTGTDEDEAVKKPLDDFVYLAESPVWVVVIKLGEELLAPMT